jgi:hypothetical protein
MNRVADFSPDGAVRVAVKLVEWVWQYFNDSLLSQQGSKQLQPDQPVKLTGMSSSRAQSHHGTLILATVTI